MHPALRQKIGQLAADFATGIVNLLQDQPLSMLTSEGGGVTTSAPTPTRTRAPRAATSSVGGRRSPEAMAKMIKQIVDAVAASPEGLRSEQIQSKTGLSKREIVRPLQLALKESSLRRVGEKRSTTYFVPGSEARRALGPIKTGKHSAARKTANKRNNKASAKTAPKKKAAKAKAAPKKVSAKPKAASKKAVAKPKAKKADKHVNSAPAPQTAATA